MLRDALRDTRRGATGPSTPDAAPKRAARGGGAYGFVRRTSSSQSARTARRLGLVVGSSHARGRTRRASPGEVACQCGGGWHAACAWVGMTRTDNKPLFRNRNAARSALLDERARGMRAMRASQTPSEALLWARIRGRRLGVVFRRQVPLLGRFIADFLAPAERLVIEVDGGHHAEQARADAHRDAVLARAGYRVLRLDAALVVGDIEAAIALVRAALQP